MSEKLSELMLRKLLGKREALPGGDKQLSPQMTPKPPADAASAPTPPTADFRGLTNPKRIIEDRLSKAEQGMKCGGKVKKMASGGSVRGTGCAVKGFGKGKVC